MQLHQAREILMLRPRWMRKKVRLKDSNLAQRKKIERSYFIANVESPSPFAAMTSGGEARTSPVLQPSEPFWAPLPDQVEVPKGKAREKFLGVNMLQLFLLLTSCSIQAETRLHEPSAEGVMKVSACAGIESLNIDKL